MPHVFQNQFSGNKDVWTLISQHWDGEIIARTVRPFGVFSIRGSSTRGGREAFGEMVQRMQAGGAVAITPDGPRGPRYRVQAGIVRLAKETGTPIVPVSWSARPRWSAWSWDRFQVPVPFARVFAQYGEPLYVNGESASTWIEDHRVLLERQMNGLNHQTDSLARGARGQGWLSWGYNVLLFFFSLLAIPFFTWKILTVAKHRAGFIQRLGFYRSPERVEKKSKPPLWVHAVSVGEVLATVPLVQKLIRAYPQFPVVASTITPTGQAVARSKFAEACRIIYFPFDYPFSIRLALKSVRPCLFVHTETEIWPNFLFTLGRKGIPSAIVNGRISSRSSRHYGWFRFFFRPVLANISVFGMQSRLDCYRIIRIGADPRRVFITGNMKFDIPLHGDAEERMDTIRAEMGFALDNLLFVAGSTHAGEEEILLDVYVKLKKEIPNMKMLLAPRHPERCDEVERLCDKRRVVVGRRTRRKSADGEGRVDVLLLDTIGELAQAYSMGDVVFVGGSLVPVGGHNLLEPVMHKKPVLFGPYTENTVDIANELKQTGGGVEVYNRESVFLEAKRLFEDLDHRESVGRAAYGILEEHRGATERNLAILRPFLES